MPNFLPNTLNANAIYEALWQAHLDRDRTESESLRRDARYECIALSKIVTSLWTPPASWNIPSSVPENYEIFTDWLKATHQSAIAELKASFSTSSPPRYTLSRGSECLTVIPEDDNHVFKIYFPKDSPSWFGFYLQPPQKSPHNENLVLLCPALASPQQLFERFTSTNKIEGFAASKVEKIAPIPVIRQTNLDTICTKEDEVDRWLEAHCGMRIQSKLSEESCSRRFEPEVGLNQGILYSPSTKIFVIIP